MLVNATHPSIHKTTALPLHTFTTHTNSLLPQISYSFVLSNFKFAKICQICKRLSNLQKNLICKIFILAKIWKNYQNVALQVTDNRARRWIFGITNYIWNTWWVLWYLWLHLLNWSHIIITILMTKTKKIR